MAKNVFSDLHFHFSQTIWYGKMKNKIILSILTGLYTPENEKWAGFLFFFLGPNQVQNRGFDPPFLAVFIETQHLAELLHGLEFRFEFLFFFSFLNSNKSEMLFAGSFLLKNAPTGGAFRRPPHPFTHGKADFWPIFLIFAFFHFLVFKMAFV